MEIIYNEFSSTPLSLDETTANKKAVDFISTIKESHNKGFKKIRFPVHLEHIILSAGYSIKDWLNKSNQKNLKNILLSAREYPEYNEEHEWFSEEYIRNTYYFENKTLGIDKSKSFGIASAYIYNTLSISMNSHDYWCNNSLPLTKKSEETLIEESINVPNVFSTKCFDNLQINSFIDRISGITLLKTDLKPSTKQINFRPDHGTDVLEAHAKLLNQSPYVIGVFNSIAWKSQEINYIKKVFTDGKIYIRLHRTDVGLGMAIQTTGRNLKETNAISKILKEEFDR